MSRTPSREVPPMSAGMTEADRHAVSILQACKHVGVSRRTIYNWMASGKVEYVRTAGGAVRIFTDTLWQDGSGSGGASGARGSPGIRR